MYFDILEEEEIHSVQTREREFEINDFLKKYVDYFFTLFIICKNVLVV